LQSGLIEVQKQVITVPAELSDYKIELLETFKEKQNFFHHGRAKKLLRDGYFEGIGGRTERIDLMLLV
jgi:hypothetical protein